MATSAVDDFDKSLFELILIRNHPKPVRREVFAGVFCDYPNKVNAVADLLGARIYEDGGARKILFGLSEKRVEELERKFGTC